jgi:phosphoribosylpyrophosphate synthetase
MQSNAKIFSGRGSRYLAEKIAAKFGEELGKVKIQAFSDGEIGVENTRIASEVNSYFWFKVHLPRQII